MAKRSSTAAKSKSAAGSKSAKKAAGGAKAAKKPAKAKTAGASGKKTATTKKTSGAKGKTKPTGTAKTTTKKAPRKKAASTRKKSGTTTPATTTPATAQSPTLPDLPPVDPAQHLGLVDAAPGKLPPVKIAKRDSTAIEQALHSIRAQLTNDVDALTQNNLTHSGRDMSGDLSGYGFHMADVATDNFAREMELNIATNETDRLRLVEEALDRMHDGTFGRCLHCGEPVGVPRLKVIPYARFCIRCAEEEEADRA